ncbi:unnamed protein product [Rotaria socialis]|uniref:Mono(ADP-ribosyl)transferase n=1 Tax=Rotaria socialis TaxID=392032 RepID=A0A818LA66_9BILA|nr:unnamed protein product [Rotaria socialis]
MICLSLSSFRIVSKGRLYTYEMRLTSIIWFPLNISGGSPNYTRVPQCNPDGTNITLSSTVIAFDGVRNLFYITGYENPSLLIIMNITGDCMVMITKSNLILTNGLMLTHPCSILVDETSGSFYVLDMALKIMAKFSFGSITGTIIISNLLNNMDPTGYGSCGIMMLDSSGQLYMTDFNRPRVVQLLNDKGDMRTVAGMGFAGNSNKRLQRPRHFGFDAHHNLYVSDGPNHRTTDRTSLRPWFKYLKLLLTALVKIPCAPTQTVWRGVRKNVDDEFPKGAEVTWWCFSSTTISLDLLKSDVFLGTIGERTIFSIEVINGRSIKDHSEYNNEGEVLLLPGTYMEVQAQLNPASELHIIHLKQKIPKELLLEPPFEGI